MKKKKTIEQPVVEQKAEKQSDQSGSHAADGVLEDVNSFINDNIGEGSNKRIEAYNLPCGVVYADSLVSNGVKTYNMRYGKEVKCGYKKKSGIVSFYLAEGKSFNEPGARIRITLKDYVVESEANGDVVTLNGYFISENVTGGYLWETILNNRTITHRIRGAYNVTYRNGVTRARNSYQSRTWTSSSGWSGLTLVIKGDTLNDVSETGNTLEGNYPYTTHILKPFRWENCGKDFRGAYVLTQGKARMVAAVPGISPAYFQIEAGYYVTGAASPDFMEGCQSNVYKITTVLGTNTNVRFQLY